MSITHIISTDQLDKILSKSPDKLTVIDFHATWCGPCKAIAPTFDALSRQYKDVNFLKCDVDKVQDVAGRYVVSVMPTFVFLKGSNKVDEVKGSDPLALKGAVERHSSGVSGSTIPFGGRGQTLGGPSTSTPDIGTGGVINLTPQAKVLLGLMVAYILLWFLS